jgi:predicted ArsR family transcriptional regulator
VGEGRRESYGDQPSTDSATDQEASSKLTVSEAAESLGISPDAVRSRIKRGTLPTRREGGRVFVVFGATDRLTNRPRPTTQPSEDSGEERLYQEMTDRIRYLERQVEEEREARRRADTLLAQLMQRIPELEAPTETRGKPETDEADTERAESRRATGGAQERVQRPWWRRWFGG